MVILVTVGGRLLTVNLEYRISRINFAYMHISRPLYFLVDFAGDWWCFRGLIPRLVGDLLTVWLANIMTYILQNVMAKPSSQPGAKVSSQLLILCRLCEVESDVVCLCHIGRTPPIPQTVYQYF